MATSQVRNPSEVLTCMTDAPQPYRLLPQLSENAAMAGFVMGAAAN